MALDARIRELSARHRALDEAIALETRSPAGDRVRVMEMKRQKLKLKEELEALRARPLN